MPSAHPAPGHQSRNVTDRPNLPNLPITHRYIYFAGTLAPGLPRSDRSRGFFLYGLSDDGGFDDVEDSLNLGCIRDCGGSG